MPSVRSLQTLIKKPRLITARLRTPGAVSYHGQLLPPASIRLGGEHFQDDGVFLETGRADAKKLHDEFEISASSAILDVGCGVGRLAIGLLAEFGELSHYTGVDVAEPSVRWCQKHIEAHHEGTKFIHLDVANARYSRRGKPIDKSFRLPFANASADVIYLYSVFSHMETEDVASYLQEFARLLTPTGGIFLTAFVEDDVEDMAVNPDGYGSLKWEGPLHCVRFNRGFFLALVEQGGLSVSRLDHGTETDGQSAIYLRPLPRSVA
jgi:SAM-dependent methyltransferase